jgi:hypothetical protein
MMMLDQSTTNRERHPEPTLTLAREWAFISATIEPPQPPMSAAKGSILFVSVPPEGEEPTVVYRELQKKVYNNGSQLGEISRFAIPQFKVSSQLDKS